MKLFLTGATGFREPGIAGRTFNIVAVEAVPIAAIADAIRVAVGAGNLRNSLSPGEPKDWESLPTCRAK
jgi:hypothetical protein